MSDAASSVEALKELVAKAEGSIQLSLKECAALDGITSKHLGIAFRDCVGESFREYCRSIRMAAAAHLLLEEQSSTIGAIGAHLGYSDRRNFSRDFRRVFKMSPSRYRATAQVEIFGIADR